MGNYGDGCYSNVPGGIFPVRPTSCEWKPAEKVAQFAALKQAENGGIPLEYRQLVKVNMQGVGGIMYYLTFTACDTTDGREKIFKAKVMCDARDLSLHLKEFKVDNDPNKSAEKMRNEVVDVLEKIAAFRKENPHLFPVLPPRPPPPNRSGQIKMLGVHLTPKKGVIRAIAFRIFLKEMRTQNPTWKYAKVRKAASRKWKSFIINDMVPYFHKAQQEFNRKAYGSWELDGKVPNYAQSSW
ncbi:unnamed protein product [Cuscuta campestris]|uniref:Cysteine proteinase inhibitor n=1 Tax=Cuscuta campestris TaxID=132261 RepID=A0A484KSX6_9ASTE|nr:unnamed protein product [Cuscuta campestris]